MSTLGVVLLVIAALWVGGLGGLVLGAIVGERRREQLQGRVAADRW